MSVVLWVCDPGRWAVI